VSPLINVAGWFTFVVCGTLPVCSLLILLVIELLTLEYVRVGRFVSN
jgi:hypothetical protein